MAREESVGEGRTHLTVPFPHCEKAFQMIIFLGLRAYKGVTSSPGQVFQSDGSLFQALVFFPCFIEDSIFLYFMSTKLVLGVGCWWSRESTYGDSSIK